MSGHPYSRPEESTGFLLQRVSLLWQRQMNDRLRPFDLTLTQFQLLAGIRWLSETDEGPITQKRLARHTGCDMMVTSQVLRRLADRGLLCREVLPEDRRSVRLRLLPRGERLLVQALPVAMQADAAVFAALGAGEAELRRQLLPLKDL